MSFRLSQRTARKSSLALLAVCAAALGVLCAVPAAREEGEAEEEEQKEEDANEEENSQKNEDDSQKKNPEDNNIYIEPQPAEDTDTGIYFDDSNAQDPKLDDEYIELDGF